MLAISHNPERGTDLIQQRAKTAAAEEKRTAQLYIRISTPCSKKWGMTVIITIYMQAARSEDIRGINRQAVSMSSVMGITEKILSFMVEKPKIRVKNQALKL